MNAPAPFQPRSDFLRVMIERGYLHQCTDLEGLDARLTQGVVTAYNGFDATGDSLHIGHLVPIMILRWFQKTGHRPIALMGGGTTKVGDPSGKDETRKLLTDAEIASNIASIQKTFDRFLTFGPESGAGLAGGILVNNADWLDELRYIPFLRDVGRHFTINRMLTFDSVKLRLEREQPLTFLEFNYMILQSYDFVELARRYGCCLQTGGSDQWGNIVNGVELGRRIADQDLFGLTCPLITTASGAKMGKTAAGAVWLNADKLSPYQYYQFWRNTEDADVGRFLKLFTELSLPEIAKLEALPGAEINEAKKVLAFEATALCHGREAAESAAETARKTFEQGALGSDVPSVIYTVAEIEIGVSAASSAAALSLAPSISEAKRLIKQGAFSVNDRKINDINYRYTSEDVQSGEVKISIGRKKHGRVLIKKDAD